MVENNKGKTPLTMKSIKEILDWEKKESQSAGILWLVIAGFSFSVIGLLTNICTHKGISLS